MAKDSGLKGRAEDEYFMDRQYQYFFVSDSNHHGFLFDDSGECIDSLVEKGIAGSTEFQLPNIKSTTIPTSRGGS